MGKLFSSANQLGQKITEFPISCCKNLGRVGWYSVFLYNVFEKVCIRLYIISFFMHIRAFLCIQRFF